MAVFAFLFDEQGQTLLSAVLFWKALKDMVWPSAPIFIVLYEKA